MNSTAFSLTTKDGLRGLIMAIGTPIIYVIQTLIPSWQVWLTAHIGATGSVLVITALSALLTYLIKNFFTDTVAQSQINLVDAAKKQGLDATEIKVSPTAVTAPPTTADYLTPGKP